MTPRSPHLPLWLMHHLRCLTQETKAGYVEAFGSQNGLFSPYIQLKQAWQWAAISAMHQIAQWRGREADRGSSVTRRPLCLRVSFGTCAQGLGKSRWHVGVFNHTSCLFSLREHLSLVTSLYHRVKQEAEETPVWGRTLCSIKSSFFHTWTLWVWLQGEHTQML